MSHKRSIITALFIGWVSGAGSWYFIAKGQDAAGGQGQGGAPSAVMNPPVDGAGEELVAVLPLPVGLGNPPAVSARVALPLAVHDVPPEMSTLLMEPREAMGVSSDDGVVQDTGEFIDADDPQAYVAWLNARSDDDTVQDTGKFLDVENPSTYTDNDSPLRDTGEFIDVDDPQAYAAYWDRQSDGVVHDTGEFVAVDSR